MDDKEKNVSAGSILDCDDPSVTCASGGTCTVNSDDVYCASCPAGHVGTFCGISKCKLLTFPFPWN